MAIVFVTICTSAFSDASDNSSIALYNGNGDIIDKGPLLNNVVHYDTETYSDKTTYIISSGTPLELIEGAYLGINTEEESTLVLRFSDVNGYLAETGILVKFFIRDSGEEAGCTELKENDHVMEGINNEKVTTGNYLIKMYTLYEYRDEVVPVKTENMAMSFSIDGSVHEYHILSDSGDGGTISPSGDVAVLMGKSRTFTITPDASHVIKDVTVDGVSQGPISTYTFTNVNDDHTIHAEFEQRIPPTTYHTLEYDSNGASGTVPPTKKYPSGTPVAIASADGLYKEGCYFSGWNTAADGSGRTYYPGNTLILNKDTTLYAQWTSVPTYTITVIQTDNGTITPDTVIVREGSSATFEIKPNDGYAVHEVLVDGESVGSMGRYTFENVHEDHMIFAVYEKKEHACEIWPIILIIALIVALLIAIIIIARKKTEEQ